MAKELTRIVPTSQSLKERAAETAERISMILDEGTPENTRRAYAGDLAYMEAWCLVKTGHNLPFPTPIELVYEFITDHVFGLKDKSVENALIEMGMKARPGPHKMATIVRRISTLSVIHQTKGMKERNPCWSAQVKVLMKKARKRAVRRGERPSKKRAITRDLLEEINRSFDKTNIRDVRDKAILCFAWASGGRRRSEVAAARYEDLTRHGNGFIYTLPFSKTDQDGKGVKVPVQGVAARALTEWLRRSGINAGPIFRPISKTGTIINRYMTPQDIARIVKRHAANIGMDPSSIGGHSLRSGFVTSAGKMGIPIGSAMAMSTHRDTDVFMSYYQEGEMLNNPAADMLKE